MRRQLLIVGGAVAAATVATPASAAICIGVAINGAAPVSKACDTPADPGFASYVATSGGYFFNVSGTGSPIVDMPRLLTQSINIERQGGVASIIDVYITQTDLTSLNSSLLSSFTSNTVLGLTAQITSYYDVLNGLFAGTQLQTSSFTGTGSYEGANYVNVAGPWSETVRYRLNFTGGVGSNFNGTVNLAAVPEPATWALMLLGFGGIGMAMRRQRRTPKLAQIA
jgi:hypothetical protein